MPIAIALAVLMTVALLGFGCVGDVLTTNGFLARGGLESNSICRWAQRKFGLFLWGFVIKGPFALAIVLTWLLIPGQYIGLIFFFPTLWYARTCYENSRVNT